MKAEVEQLLVSIRSKPWPRMPFKLNSGETVLDTGKLVSRTDSYLKALEGREHKQASQMYLERLRLLNKRLDEVRGVEQDAGGFPAEAAA